MIGQSPITFEGMPGLYFYETGEFRAPRKGEYYLSGAVLAAYRAPNDLTTAYRVARPTYRAVSQLARRGALYGTRYRRGGRVQPITGK